MMTFPNSEHPPYYDFNMKTSPSPEPLFPPELSKWLNDNKYSDFIYFYSFDTQIIHGFLFATDKNNDVFRACGLKLNYANVIIAVNWKQIKPTEIQKWTEIFHRQFNHFRLKQKQILVKSKLENISTDFKENTP